MSGTITRIERTRDEPPRLQIYVDGALAFTVSEELARELGLAVGEKLVRASAGGHTDAPDTGRATRADANGPSSTKTSPSVADADGRRGSDVDGAREAALRLLAVRARSEGELADRLRRKGFENETATRVVSTLKEVGLVDDEAFARAWVDEKLRLRPSGPRRLTAELLAHRVPRELAEAVVSETFRKHPEVEVARRAVGPRARAVSAADPRKRRSRLQSFLVRRGFSYDVASEVLREIERTTEGDSDA